MAPLSVRDGTNGFALLASFLGNTSPPKRGGNTEVFARSVRDRAPAGGQLVGAAQRKGEERVGRVRGAFGREDARPGNPQIGNLVGLAVAVDHRVRRTGAHDGA